MRALWTLLLLIGCSDGAQESNAFIEGQKHYLGPAHEEPDQDQRCRGSLESFQPEGGMLPTREVAERIARSYLRSLYGSVFRDEEPLETRLERGVWTISTILPEGAIGGTIEISICRSNGRVLGYSASQ